MNNPIYILGDFNYDLKNISKKGKQYTDILGSFLLDQLITTPTRVTETTATILDHIWISEPETVISSGVLPGVSDHHMTYVRIQPKLKKNSQPQKHFQQEHSEIFVKKHSKKRLKKLAG